MSCLKSGLTLIELIMAIVLIGIIMVPAGLMCGEYIRGLAYSEDLGVAEGLAMTEMAKINNLAYGHATLADGYDNTTSSYEGYDLDLRREVDYVAGSSNNLKKVVVTVYEGGTVSTLVSLTTYVADVTFGSGSGGGGLAGGDADSLVISGGSISGKTLQNITLENLSGDPVTITGATATFTGPGGIKVTEIEMDSLQRWSGNKASPASITLDTNFELSADTEYSDTCDFTFSKNLTSATISFTASDASTTEDYTWP